MSLTNRKIIPKNSDNSEKSRIILKFLKFALGWYSLHTMPTKHTKPAVRYMAKRIPFCSCTVPLRCELLSLSGPHHVAPFCPLCLFGVGSCVPKLKAYFIHRPPPPLGFNLSFYSYPFMPSAARVSGVPLPESFSQPALRMEKKKFVDKRHS